MIEQPYVNFKLLMFRVRDFLRHKNVEYFKFYALIIINGYMRNENIKYAQLSDSRKDTRSASCCCADLAQDTTVSLDNYIFIAKIFVY